MIGVMIIGFIIPKCLHLVKDRKEHQAPPENSSKAELGTESSPEYDPFSDQPEPARKSNTPEQVRVTFISCGSGTKELDFDSLVLPFSHK